MSLLLIFLSFLSNCQEKLLLIRDPKQKKAEPLTILVGTLIEELIDEKSKANFLERIKKQLNQLKQNHTKIYFDHTDGIINFIRYAKIEPPKKLEYMIKKIQKHDPYITREYHINDIEPGDTLIEFILEKLEAMFFEKIDNAQLIKDFNNNIIFYEKNFVKKVKLKGNDDDSLIKENDHNSSIIYLLGLTLCAASLIFLYTFFNPYILKRIYQPS